MRKTTTPKSVHASERIKAFQHEFGQRITDLLGEINLIHLRGKGKTATKPVEGNILHWTLAWKQDKVAFDLNIVVNVKDDGKQARAESVFVHRHASTPYDFAGHTPTTRMRRLAGNSILGIKRAIQAEFAQDQVPGRKEAGLGLARWR